MIKTSFAVSFRHNDKSYAVLGVTSVLPNLNGVLFCTENKEHFYIESYEIPNGLEDMRIDYDQSKCMELCDIVFDHREK